MWRRLVRREKVLVFKKTLDHEPAAVDGKIPVEVTFVQAETARRIVEQLQKLRIRTEERLGRGHVCAAATDSHGRIVHMTWIAFENTYAAELETTLRLRSGESYIYDIRTLPEYRGLGIAPMVIQETLAYLARRGIRIVYGLTQHNNLRSIRVFQKAHFHLIGLIGFTRVINLKRFTYRGETIEYQTRIRQMFQSE